jgi:hypothetical protein
MGWGLLADAASWCRCGKYDARQSALRRCRVNRDSGRRRDPLRAEQVRVRSRLPGCAETRCALLSGSRSYAPIAPTDWASKCRASVVEEHAPKMVARPRAGTCETVFARDCVRVV